MTTISGNTVHWATRAVTLEADDFSIVADGKIYLGTNQSLSVSSDFGNESYRTLEVRWQEYGLDMGLNLYFIADDADWWVNEIRTYNGQNPAEWIYYTGQFFGSPRGKAWTGSIDLISDPRNTVVGKIYLKNMTLWAF
jgi:hypothetical protein